MIPADTNAAIAARDLAVLWHPCTQMKDHEWLPMVPIRRGEGVWLEDFEGKRYLDAISSWWVNLFGHANPRINAALRDQLAKLEHVILAGFTHEPALDLAERLVALTPPGLDRVLLRRQRLGRGRGGAEDELPLLAQQRRAAQDAVRHPRQQLPRRDAGRAGGGGRRALQGDLRPAADGGAHRALARLLRARARRVLGGALAPAASPTWRRCSPRHADEVCAVIVEPLVQCAGAMRMYHPVYLALLREACDRHGVHLIADEIAVGFGRTGTLFACEQAGITPDFLCLSKGLTGGYLPLAAVLTSEPVYAAFYDDYRTLRAFLHSHSYTGNPLACRAALATLDILEADDVIAANRTLARAMAEAAAPLADHPQVGEVRQTGMILAIEMVKDKASRTPYPWQERRGLRVYRHGLEQGALLRPLGNVVYLMPPYVITPEQIRWVAQVAADGIDVATRD